MNNQKKLVEAINKLKLNGYEETVVTIYANNNSKKFSAGVLGKPDILHLVWLRLIERYRLGTIGKEELFIVETFMVALAQSYTNEELTAKFDQIRKEIDQANKANLN